MIPMLLMLCYPGRLIYLNQVTEVQSALGILTRTLLISQINWMCCTVSRDVFVVSSRQLGRQWISIGPRDFIYTCVTHYQTLVAVFTFSKDVFLQFVLHINLPLSKLTHSARQVNLIISMKIYIRKG